MSEKPVAQKLLIKPGRSVRFMYPPPEYGAIMAELPQDVTIIENDERQADVVQLFVSSMRELEERLPGAMHALAKNGLLWVTYPKGSAKKGVDINRDIIWEYAKTLGMEGVAMISIDATWSAMRLKESG